MVQVCLVQFDWIILQRNEAFRWPTQLLKWCSVETRMTAGAKRALDATRKERMACSFLSDVIVGKRQNSLAGVFLFLYCYLLVRFLFGATATDSGKHGKELDIESGTQSVKKRWVEFRLRAEQSVLVCCTWASVHRAGYAVGARRSSRYGASGTNPPSEILSTHTSTSDGIRIVG